MEKVKRVLKDFWMSFLVFAMCIQENIELLEGIGLEPKIINIIRILGAFGVFYVNYYKNKKKS